MAGTFINHSTTVAVTQSNKMNEEKKMGEHFLIPTKIRRANTYRFRRLVVKGKTKNHKTQSNTLLVLLEPYVAVLKIPCGDQ